MVVTAVELSYVYRLVDQWSIAANEAQ